MPTQHWKRAMITLCVLLTVATCLMTLRRFHSLATVQRYRVKTMEPVSMVTVSVLVTLVGMLVRFPLAMAGAVELDHVKWIRERLLVCAAMAMWECLAIFHLLPLDANCRVVCMECQTKAVLVVLVRCRNGLETTVTFAN